MDTDMWGQSKGHYKVMCKTCISEICYAKCKTSLMQIACVEEVWMVIKETHKKGSYNKV